MGPRRFWRTWWANCVAASSTRLARGRPTGKPESLPVPPNVILLAAAFTSSLYSGGGGRAKKAPQNATGPLFAPFAATFPQSPIHYGRAAPRKTVRRMARGPEVHVDANTQAAPSNSRRRAGAGPDRPGGAL